MAIKVKKDVGISPTHSTFRQYTAMINAVRRTALIAIVRNKCHGLFALCHQVKLPGYLWSMV